MQDALPVQEARHSLLVLDCISPGLGITRLSAGALSRMEFMHGRHNAVCGGAMTIALVIDPLAPDPALDLSGEAASATLLPFAARDKVPSEARPTRRGPLCPQRLGPSAYLILYA